MRPQVVAHRLGCLIPECGGSIDAVMGVQVLHHALLSRVEGRCRRLERLIAVVRPQIVEDALLPWAYHSLGETALGQGHPDDAKRWLRLALTVSQLLTDQASIAWRLAGLGTAAALDEEPDRAARLWGAAERLRQAIGCRPAPAARATYERAIALARAQLDEAAFAAAWAEGWAIPLEQAIAEALDDAAEVAGS
jgi:hypothetical protein